MIPCPVDEQTLKQDARSWIRLRRTRYRTNAWLRRFWYRLPCDVQGRSGSSEAPSHEHKKQEGGHAKFSLRNSPRGAELLPSEHREDVVPLAGLLHRGFAFLDHGIHREQNPATFARRPRGGAR